jgi:hypothetical protein
VKIHKESIGHLCLWIAAGKRFSFAGFSDAEWFCIFGERHGEKTGFGQVLDREYGKRLLDIIRRRQADDRFIFAVPSCLYQLPSFCNGEIDWLLGRENIRMEAFERDKITDDAAMNGRELHQFVRMLRRVDHTVMIGNGALRVMEEHLSLKRFIEVSSPNLHLEPGGIERAVAEAVDYGKPGVYLVSAGVSAAVIIDQLHDAIPRSWFIDMGSAWDAFAGIGGQREWRARLYADPPELERWKRRVLYGR